MNFTDAVTILPGTRRTTEGYMVSEARAVRTGIQLYSGDEVGRPDMSVARIYRSPEEVFSDAALQSFTHAPITINHPSVAVDADNWKDLAVGEVSTMAKKDGDWVMLPLILKDAAGITSVESGKRQLSAGYTCELDWKGGTTADGQVYDAQQRNIKINHLAIVDAARAGERARIGDDAGKWGASPVPTQAADERINKMNLRTVLVDGLQVETTDAGAQAITKLLADLSASTAKITTLQNDHKAAIDTKDGEIGSLKADLKKAQDSAPKPADLDKLVADRAALVSVVHAIDSKIDASGKSDAELRKAAVTAKLGDEMVKDASDAEIAGMFKAVAKDVKGADPFRTAVGDGIKVPVTPASAVSDAWNKSVTDLNAWRKEA